MASNISIIRKNSLLAIVGSGLFLFVGFAFVNLFLTGLLLQLVKLALGFELNGGITYIVLLTVILGWYLTTSIKGGVFREFSIDDTSLSIKKLTGQTMVLQKDEIRKVEWKKNTFIFHRMDSPFLVTTPNWAMTNILFYWIPENLLPLEVRHFIKEAKGLAKKSTPIFEKPRQVGTKANIFSGLVELNNKGIRYKTLLGQKFFCWNDVEVVEVRLKGKELKIWVNGQYTRIRLTFFTAQEQAILQKEILDQVYTRGIPVCYSETKS